MDYNNLTQKISSLLENYSSIEYGYDDHEEFIERVADYVYRNLDDEDEITDALFERALRAVNKKRRVARCFEDIGGYYICDDTEDYLDARGMAYKTKAECIGAAAYSDFTHAVGSGTYWKGVKKIPRKFYA